MWVEDVEDMGGECRGDMWGVWLRRMWGMWVEDVGGGCGRVWEDVGGRGGCGGCVWGWRMGDVAGDVDDVGGSFIEG